MVVPCRAGFDLGKDGLVPVYRNLDFERLECMPGEVCLAEGRVGIGHPDIVFYAVAGQVLHVDCRIGHLVQCEGYLTGSGKQEAA